MKKLKRIAMAMALAVACMELCCTGCASYAKTGAWAPQGVNYTLSRDRQTGDLTDYWGATWSFK